MYLQNLVAANYHADQAAQKAARKRAAAAAAAAPPPQTAPEAHPTAAASPHGCHDVCAAPAGSATVTIIPAGSEGGGAVANTSYAAQPDRGLSTATAAEGAGLSTSAPLNACGVDASGVVLNVAPPLVRVTRRGAPACVTCRGAPACLLLGRRGGSRHSPATAPCVRVCAARPSCTTVAGAMR